MLKNKNTRSLLILALIWLAGAVSDRLWLALDRSVPAWDQAEYLTGAMNYWQALQQPQWFNGEWWKNFWMLSTKVPPLTFIATAMVQNLVGTGPELATLVNLFFSAVLLGSVYGLGVQLFSVEMGLWAAGLCQLLPSLYQIRLNFLLDYPLTAMVTLSFCCLTIWRATGNRQEDTQTRDVSPCSLMWAAAWGISFGLALLVKQTALFFLLTPILWVGISTISRHQWRRLLQLVGGLLLSIVVFGPWYRTNWLLALTGGKRATVDAAIAEGDPELNTLAAWTYYWEILPDQVSWLLLLVPIVGLLLYWGRKSKFSRITPNYAWLAIFWLGAYLLCSLNINKDDRYTLPYLPVVAIFLATGLTSWRGRWGRQIRWGTVGLAALLMFLNLFPMAGSLASSVTQVLSPKAQHYAYLGAEFPHPQVIEQIIQTAPYTDSTLGVLPSTPEINQHNLNYYGTLRDFQVYGRQVGIRAKQVNQDTRSLDWFLTKTGDQGSVPEAQAAIVQLVEQSPDFQLHHTWNLGDRAQLKLFHRRQPTVQVKPLPDRSQEPGSIVLSQVTVPPQAPPGIPVPVTYEWSGNWEQLQSGLVLLTWHQATSPPRSDRWIHDHGIGMGTLHHSSLRQQFQVIERTAMLPPADLPAGTYNLEATYLNRRTGETYPIAVPTVTLQIDPKATATPAPELDLLTQHRTLAATLPQGIKALDFIFAEVARINQYDPIQDYLAQVQLAMLSRLQLEPQNLDWAYALALSQVLQQQVQGAVAALQRVTQLDSQNPYAYAYLAFVHLYNWDGTAAAAALKPAIALRPKMPELQALSIIAALMQGDLVRAWQYLQVFRSMTAQATPT